MFLMIAVGAAILAVMWWPSKEKGCFVKILVFLVVFILVYFSDNIYGQYQFEKLCRKDGGLHVQEKLKKNVGWYFGSGSMSMKYLSGTLTNVGFIRYEKKGISYDTYFWKEGKKDFFRTEPSDFSKKVTYKISDEKNGVPYVIRLGSTTESVVEVATGRVLVTSKSYAYDQFNPDNTLFHTSTWVTCGGVDFFDKKVENLVFEN